MGALSTNLKEGGRTIPGDVLIEESALNEEVRYFGTRAQ